MVLFNLGFISFVQNILLFLLTSPYLSTRESTDFRNYLVMLIGDKTPINSADILLTVAFIGCLSLETIADEQQWIYQNAKHAKPAKETRSASKQARVASYCQPEDLQRGFIAGGLFKYSRHPNFACEQAIWFIFYAFGCNATVCVSH